METPHTDLKVDLEWTEAGRPVRISLHVTGEGPAAELAASDLSRAVSVVMLRAARHDITTAESLTRTSPTPVAIQAQTQMQPHAVSAAAPAMPSPMQTWFRQNRTRVNIVFGGVLLALALLVPLVVPADQRREVLVLTILFALTGALLLFTAFLPSRNSASATTAPSPEPQKAPTPMPDARLSVRKRELLRTTKPTVRTGWGLAMGSVFVVVGLLAPFLLGAASADERFVIMLGFAPVVVIGFFMLAIFGRPYWARLQPTTSGSRVSHPSAAQATTAPKRAPVSRVPQNFEYRAVVPIAIVAVVVLMAVVLAVVLFATLSSAVR